MQASFLHRRNALCLTGAVVFAAALLLPGCLQRTEEHANAPAEITLLTTNDLHGRLEPFTMQTNGVPQSAGGFAALAALMDSAEKNSHGPVLRFNSGDTLTGPYALHFNGEALFGGLSRMNIDAATLGNHDFDRGPAALAQALTHCSYPVVVTNIELSADHVLSRSLVPFHVFKRAGKRLLVVGLLTPDLNRISSPGPGITVLDPGSAKIRLKIRELIRQHSPDLVIALTHLGLEQDRRLAARVPEIDIICGGHSHDLLPAGRQVLFNHAGNRQTVIVQAGSGGIALGVLHVKPGPEAKQAYVWLPETTLNTEPCPSMDAFVKRHRAQLPPARPLTASQAAIDCRGATLRTREAPIGSFIADALRARFNTDVALYNGGGIRGDYMLPAGPIISMDIETMLPFGNEAAVISMTGAMLMQVLEHSVSRLPRPWGGFLQVSGLRMRVGRQKRPAARQRADRGRRVISVDIQAADGVYRPLVDGRIYRVATNTFLAQGGDGYSMFKEAHGETRSGEMIRTIVTAYLADRPQHSFTADGRISIQAGSLKQRRQYPAHNAPYPPSPGMDP